MLLAKNLNWYACLKNDIEIETYDIYYKLIKLTIKNNYKKIKIKRIENLSEVKKPPHFINVRRFYLKIREVRRTFYKVRRTFSPQNKTDPKLNMKENFKLKIITCLIIICKCKKVLFISTNPLMVFLQLFIFKKDMDPNSSLGKEIIEIPNGGPSNFVCKMGKGNRVKKK